MNSSILVPVELEGSVPRRIHRVKVRASVHFIQMDGCDFGWRWRPLDVSRRGRGPSHGRSVGTIHGAVSLTLAGKQLLPQIVFCHHPVECHLLPEQIVPGDEPLGLGRHPR